MGPWYLRRSYRREYRWEAFQSLAGKKYRPGWNDWNDARQPFAAIDLELRKGEWKADARTDYESENLEGGDPIQCAEVPAEGDKGSAPKPKASAK